MFIIYIYFFLRIAISNIFKPANRHYRNPSPNPVAALPRFHPESKSSESSGVQTVSKPVSIFLTSQLIQDHIG